jgi:hypothetical protein
MDKAGTFSLDFKISFNGAMPTRYPTNIFLFLHHRILVIVEMYLRLRLTSTVIAQSRIRVKKHTLYLFPTESYR